MLIHQRADFSFVRYGSVWEDAETLCRALKPVAKGARLLSIASAGDNVLALLSLDPREVVAVDLSASQLACLELRIAAFQGLAYGPLLEFLGLRESDGRLEVYARLRRRLGKGAREFWDANQAAVADGIIHAGKLERFLKRYQGWLRRWVHNSEAVDAFLSPMSAGEREAAYRRWDSWRWRLLNRLAFSQRVIGALGRDPQFFKHADRDVTTGPLRRLALALRHPAAHSNAYLCYHLTGNYAPGALPLYLRPGSYAALRRRSGRLRLLLGQVEDAPGRYAGFNLSNIFEYMSPQQHATVYARLLDKAMPGARLAYWNLHVDRALPVPEKKRAKALTALALRLHGQDRSWVYRAFHVDEAGAQSSH